MTFDFAQDHFRSSRTPMTASVYMEQALIYWTDEMISDETFIAAYREVMHWLQKC